MKLFPWIKTFPQFDSTESRRHKLCQKDPACVTKMTHAQGGTILYILSPHYVKQKEHSMIQLLDLE